MANRVPAVDNSSYQLPPLVRERLSANLNDSAEPEGAAVQRVAGAPVLGNAFRKRVLHNLVYKHADWAAANALWGSLFPQTFVIDETAREILTISSQPCIISVYDYDTGAYKGHCFNVAQSVTSQAAVIRYISGTRYLYLRTASNQMSRFDITNYPTNLTTLAPTNSYSFPLISDFTYRDGVWTCATSVSDFGDTNYPNRARFIRRDESFAATGSVRFPAMMYGAPVGSGAYSLAGVPKAQGFCEAPGMYVAGIGGGWNYGSPETIFHLQGVRAFSPSGELLVDATVKASTMWNVFDGLGFSPTHIEVEGTTYAFDRVHSLYAINSSADAAASTGGLVLMEEFSTHPDALDLRAYSTPFTVTPTERLSANIHPLRDDGKLANPITWASMLTAVDVFDYMRNVGQTTLSFYTNTVNITDVSGNTFPASSYVEFINSNNSTCIIRATSATGTVVYQMSWNGSAWVQTIDDTGWVDITIAGGFAALSSPERPQVRRIGKVIYVSGAWGNTGLTASGTFSVGTVPAGFRPTKPVVGAAGTPSAATLGTGHILADGTVQIRTSATVGAYYNFGTFEYPLG